MSDRRRFSQSLSGRLLLLFVGVGMLLLVLMGVSISWGFRTQFATTALPHLVQYMDYLRQDIGTPPDLARAAELAHRLPLTIHIIGPAGQIWSSEAKDLSIFRLEYNHSYNRGGRRYAHGEVDGHEYLVMEDGIYTFAFAVPHERNPWRSLIPLTVLLLILILLYYATRRLFAPIGEIKAGVERIGRGELETPVDVRRKDELGELAGTINAMADDVQQMLDSKRQLLLAISHELRSPMTRAKVAINLVDDAVQRTDIERELNELETLIDELLETERLTSAQVLKPEWVSLKELMEEIVGNLRAESHPVLELPNDPVVARIDPFLIRLLLRNMIENALRHTPAGSVMPKMSLEVDQKNIVIKVQDYGEGIAPQHLLHVTEPFYRADPARRRETGGYGLGLYLCRRIAEVHGGRLEVSSELGHGTIVLVVLPAVRIR